MDNRRRVRSRVRVRARAHAHIHTHIHTHGTPATPYTPQRRLTAHDGLKTDQECSSEWPAHPMGNGPTAQCEQMVSQWWPLVRHWASVNGPADALHAPHPRGTNPCEYSDYRVRVPNEYPSGYSEC